MVSLSREGPKSNYFKRVTHYIYIFLSLHPPIFLYLYFSFVVGVGGYKIQLIKPLWRKWKCEVIF